MTFLVKFWKLITYNAYKTMKETSITYRNIIINKSKLYITSVLVQSKPVTGRASFSFKGFPTYPSMPSQSRTEEISPNGT